MSFGGKTTRRWFLRGTLAVAGAAALARPARSLAAASDGEALPGAGLAGPWGLSFAPSGDLYVADPGAYQVRVFDAAGRPKLAFGTPGSRDGCLNFPTGLHVFGDRVFVCDTNNGRIAVFDLEGRWKGSMGHLGIAAEKLASPNGVWASERWVWAASTRGHVIQRYSRATGVLDRAFGILGDDPAPLEQRTIEYRLRLPTAVAVDERGRVLVVDSKHGRVLALGEDGELLWASRPIWEGRDLSRPMAIATVGEALYVADTGNGRIVKLDTDGRPIGALAGVVEPHGLAVQGGRLAIAERKGAALRLQEVF